MPDPQNLPDDSPNEIQRPSQYPTATRIENGIAYDIAGKQLGPVDVNQAAQPSAQKPAFDPSAPYSTQQQSAQTAKKPAFDPNAAYSTQAPQTKQTFDPNAAYSTAPPVTTEQKTTEKQPEKKGIVRRGWDWLNKPILDNILPEGMDTAEVLRGALFQKMFGEAYIPGTNDFNTKGQYTLNDSPAKAAAKKFIAGSASDVAPVGAGLTSPLSIGTFAVGEVAQGARAVQTLSRVAKASEAADAAVDTAAAVRSARVAEAATKTAQIAKADQALQEAQAGLAAGKTTLADAAAAQTFKSQVVADAAKAEKAAQEAAELHAQAQVKAGQTARELVEASKHAERLSAQFASKLPPGAVTPLAVTGTLASKTAGAGFTGQAAAGALTPRQENEAFPDYLQRVLESAGFAALGAHATGEDIAGVAEASKHAIADIGEWSKNRTEAKQDAAQDAAKKAFTQAIKSGRGKTNYTTTGEGNDYDNMRPFLEAEHKTNDIGTPTQARNAFQNIFDKLEDLVDPQVQKYGNEPLTLGRNTDGSAVTVKQRLISELTPANEVNDQFLDKGLKAIEGFNTTNPTVAEAKKINKTLNSMVRDRMANKNNWDIQTLMDSDPKFAALYTLNDIMRDGIHETLEAKGVKGSREIRQLQKSAVNLRNAADAQVKNEEAIRKGTEPSTARKVLGWAAKRGTQAVAAGAGAEVGGPAGAALAEATVGGPAGEAAQNAIAPKGKSVNQLIKESMRVSGAEAGDAGKLDTTNAQPGAEAPQPHPRENTDMHFLLATHYGEMVGDTPYKDLEDRFRSDVRLKKNHGVPLEPDEKSLLMDLNKADVKEINDAKKAAEDEAKEQAKLNKANAAQTVNPEEVAAEKEEKPTKAAKEAEEAAGGKTVQPEQVHALPRDYEIEIEEEGQEPHTELIQGHSAREAIKNATEEYPNFRQAKIVGDFPEGIPNEKQPYAVPAGKLKPMPGSLVGDAGSRIKNAVETVRHELGHILVGHVNGISSHEMISHQHPAAKGQPIRAAVLTDYRPLMESNGEFTRKSIGDKLPSLVEQYMGGAAADELFSGIDRKANSGARGDVRAVKNILTEHFGFSDNEAETMIDNAIDRAKEKLSHPVTRQMLEENAPFREEGLSKTHHYSPERVEAMKAEHDRRMAEYEKGNPNDNGTSNGEAGPRPQEVEPGGQGEGLRAAAEGIAPAKYHPDLQRVIDQNKLVGSLPTGASFLTPDGKFVDLSTTHPEAIEKATGEPFNDASLSHKIKNEEPGAEDNRVKFINDTGAIRTRLRDTMAGKELVASVPAKGITQDQLVALRRAIGKVGREGNFAIERTDATPENKFYAKKDFPRVSDVDDMLRQIQAHPDQRTIQAEEASPEWKQQVAKSEWDTDDKGKYPTGYRMLKVGDPGRGEIGRLTYVGDPGDGYGRIRSSYIDENYRNQGIGKEMYKSAIEDARKRGLPELRSDTMVSNEAQHAWDSLIREGKYPIKKVYTNNMNANGQGGVEYHVDLRPNAQRTANAETLTEPKDVAEHADEYNRLQGRPTIDTQTHPHNVEFAKRTADAYDAMKHEPNNPEVKAAYDAMKNDVDKQWDYATQKMGMKLEPWTKEGQPYANSKEMAADVKNNKHLYFFQGGESPADNPLQAVDPKTGLSYNDKFRAVHDLFGHAAQGNEFGPKGEETAYQLHRQMFSPEAVPALTTETRGQNSWVNFGEHMRNPEGNVPKKGEPGFVPATERPYAEQKTGLLPEQFHAAAPGPNWAHDVAARLPEESAGGINPQNPEAPSKRYGFEILPEHRQQLDETPTAQDFQKYAQDHAEHIGMHPDMRLGWDTGGAKPELNIGAATNDLATAKKIAGKLDQRALWDNVKKEEVPVGGEGKKTEFPEYPIAQRIADLAKAEPLPEGEHTPLTVQPETMTEARPKGSTVELLDNPLKIKGTGDEGRVSTNDVALALQKFSKKQNPALVLGKAEPAEQLERAKALAEDEAKYRLAGDNSGADWYVKDMQKHDAILEKMRPELKDPAKSSLFKLVEAILSSGQKPYQNIKAAVKAWDHYTKTGEFPTGNPETGKSWGPRNIAAYGNAMDMLTRLVKENGEDGAVQWMMNEHPVSELKKYNELGVKGKKTDMAPGVMILGPKRGPFALNLHSQEAAFTADMWVNRTWNRWMGTQEVQPDGELKDAPRNDTERQLMKQSFKETGDKLGLSTSALQAVLWYYEQALYTAHGVPKESWSYSDGAQRVADGEKQSVMDFGEPQQGTHINAADFINLMKKAKEDKYTPEQSGLTPQAQEVSKQNSYAEELDKAKQSGYKVLKTGGQNSGPINGLISPDGKYIIDGQNSHEELREAMELGEDEQFDKGWVRKASPDSFQFGTIVSPKSSPVVKEVERQIILGAQPGKVFVEGDNFRLDNTTKEDIIEKGLGKLIERAIAKRKVGR